MRKKLLLTLSGVLFACLIVALVLLLVFRGGSIYDQNFDNVGYIIDDVYHDQGYLYMSDPEPDTTENVTLRIRTRRGSLRDAVIEYTVDVNQTDSENCTYHTAQMYFEQADETGYYDYWIGVIPKQQSDFSYHFKLTNDLETIYYTAAEDVTVGTRPGDRREDWLVMPNYSTPDWSKGAVWYSIMPDSFYNGDITNDKLSGNVTQNTWGNSHYGGSDYFGGDLLGIEQKLGYLKDLGVDAVFINPIWLTTHQAGYGAFDLKHIDSAFGNGNTLTSLVDALHGNDMRIMLDGVFQYYASQGIVQNTAGVFPLGTANVTDMNYYIIMRDANGNPVNSDWSHPYIDFSSIAARQYIYTQADSVMQLYLREYGVDGWRMDVGNTLTGSDENNWGTAEQILKDMRRYLKGISNDVFFLSEHATANYFTSAILDSKWNYDYGYAVRSWASGGTTQTSLASTLYSSVVRLPRSAANSSYNFLTTHDLSRIYEATGSMAGVKAAQILTMTYVGAPCIYFGDEVGMLGEPNPGVADAAPTTFGSMNWNRRDWDYEIYHLTKALTQLRKDYADVYRDGVFLQLATDEANNVFAFARMNTSGKAVTLTNQSDSVISGYQLDVRKLAVPEGTVLTDYLSGKTYAVRDGKVTVDIMPGGSVLVDGKGGSYAGMLEKFSIGGNDSLIARTGAADYQLSGEGTLSGSADSLTLAALPVYNTAELAFDVKAASGRLAAMLRADESVDAPYYAVTLENNTLSVSCRATRGGQSVSVGSASVKEGDRISIRRLADNVCVVLVNGGELETLRATAELPYEALAGIAPLSGESLASNLEIAALAPQLYTDFETNTGALFKAAGDVTVDGGRAILASGARLESDGYTRDFSVKAELTLNQGDYGALYIGKRENDSAVLAGILREEDACYAFVGSLVSGQLSVEGRVALEGSSALLQLEKSGAFYQARFAEEPGAWKSIPSAQINANYADIVCGLLSQGQLTAEFFSFGDADQDGASIGAHANYGEISFANTALGYSSYAQFRVNGGDWSYCENGLLQAAEEGSSVLYVSGKYKAFRSEYTLNVNAWKDGGSVTLAFGSESQDRVGENSLTFTLSENGAYTVADAGEELASGTLEGFACGKDIRLVFTATNQGKFVVYTGENPRILVDVQTSYREGYQLIAAQNAVYEVLNFNVYHMASNWMTGKGALSVTETAISLNAAETTYGYASLLSGAVSDFILGSNFQMAKLNQIIHGKAGILLGANAGSTPKDGGIFIAVDDNRRISVSERGEVLAEYELGEEFAFESFYLILVVQDGVVSVYADAYTEGEPTASAQPVLTCDLGRDVGGSISLYSEYASLTLQSLKIYGLQPGEDYRLTRAYTERPIEAPPLPEPEVSENPVTEDLCFTLDSREQLAQFNKYSGMTSLEKDDAGSYTGEMTVNGSGGNWNAGAAIAAGTFENYELTYKVKTMSSGGWSAAVINKLGFNDSHEVSGLLVYTNAINPGDKVNVTVYTGNNKEKVVVTNAVVGEDGYLSVKVRCVNGVLTIEAGGAGGTFDITDESICNRPTCTGGYISFNAGNNLSVFRDISVRILDGQGNYVNA